MRKYLQMGYYEAGTASIVQGETVVTGQGTAWSQIVWPTDDFGKHVGMPIPIASVDSDTQITLAYPWPGPTQTAKPYRISFTPYKLNYRQAYPEIDRLLTTGNVSALAALDGAADKLPMFTGPGALDLIAKQDLVNGVRFDVQLDDLAGRAAYDNEVAGFTVLVADVGDGRSAIYTKNSGAAADWSDPAYITGPVGPLPNVTVGNTTTLDPGSNATVTSTPTAGGVELDFGIPEGRGAKYAGSYDAGTTYELDDAVLYNGSTWIALQETTGNAPPVLPTTSNAYWSLLARQGTDGAGTGDVVGPVSATDGNVALFDGTTGKLIKNGFPVSTFMRTVLDDADAATARGTLGAQGSLQQAAAFELAYALTGDRSVYFDFHSSDEPSHADYSARIIRNAGANGAFQIGQKGAGPIQLNGGGNLTRDGHTVVHAGNSGALAGLNNCLINPLFQWNQRAVSGTVTLAAGAYGHDRWKAGAGGCTYTYSTTAGITTITITSGSLQQVVEAGCFAGRAGDYHLSWSGTAQGRINGGSYGASGAVSASLSGAANATVEFNTGTLLLPQLQFDYVSEFGTRHPQQELGMCQWYYEKSYDVDVAPGTVTATGVKAFQPASGSAAPFNSNWRFKVEKRGTPSVTIWNPGSAGVAGSIIDSSNGNAPVGISSVAGIGTGGGAHLSMVTGLTSGNQYQFHWTADAEL